MKKILILVFSNLKNDARLMRQINFLKNRYELTVCCFDSLPSNEYNIIILPAHQLTPLKKALSAVFLLLRQYSLAHAILHPYKKYLKQHLSGKHYDLIIANDVETLPLAFELATKETKVVFDAHEYAPKHFEDKLWWRIFFQGFNTFICRHYIPKVAGMMTIGQGLADEYEKNFGVKPQVVTNACGYVEMKPVEDNSETIRLVHHGIVNRSRRIELMIGIMKHLPANFTLDLVLMLTTTSSKQTKDYLQELKDLAANDPRINFPDAVPIEKIVPLLNRYDIGIIFAPPINFNYANGLPNKLFDYIQGRIGVLTGPTPEIAAIVQQYDLGVVSNDFTSQGFANKLIPLTREDIWRFKSNSNKAAHNLNAEKNEVILNNLIDSALKTN